LTAAQKLKLAQLEDELGNDRGELPKLGKCNGYLFTAVDGVTVLITLKSFNPRGGYKIPALRTYDETRFPTNLDAAVRARELFDAQNRDPSCVTGHFGPTVRTDWKCENPNCPCASENLEDRLKRSGVGRNS